MKSSNLLAGNRGKVKALAATAVAMVSMLAMSPVAQAADRMIAQQLQYGDQAVGFGRLFVLGSLGLCGLFMIGMCGWVTFRDYIMKSDHEKKFSIGALILGFALGSALVYPAGALMIGADLTGGGTQVDVNVTDFDTK